MSLTIDYWSDPLCIWAYVAEDKLQRVERRFGARVDLRWRVVPVFGSVSARFATGVWAGGPSGKRALTAKVAAAHGHAEVSGDVWVDDTPSTSLGPCSVFESVRRLEDTGDVRAGSAARWLRHSRYLFFVHNQNIVRRSVQERTIKDLDLPWDRVAQGLDDGTAIEAVWLAHEERQRLGIQGSPSWVMDAGRTVLYGNVNEAVLQATIEALLDGHEPGASRC